VGPAVLNSHISFLTSTLANYVDSTSYYHYGRPNHLLVIVSEIRRTFSLDMNSIYPDSSSSFLFSFFLIFGNKSHLQASLVAHDLYIYKCVAAVRLRTRIWWVVKEYNND
jgi:hypothetical protein